MRAYRDFLPNAPEELGAFVGLKTVPSVDPFPASIWGKRACAIISCFNGPAEEGEEVDGAVLASCRRRSSTGWARCLPGDPVPVRPVLPKGPAMVLEGRLREGADRRGDRGPYRPGSERARANCR